jgi:succinate dehydrogenase / fumarate reductase, iron-sulfur subunit
MNPPEMIDQGQTMTITHLYQLPQGQPERWKRVVNMADQHDAEGFGGCTNIGQCTEACPQEIPLDVIATLNRDYRLATAEKGVRK